jgi:hypothetical protein
MTGGPPCPAFSDAVVLERLRAAALRGLTQSRQGADDLLDAGYDIKAVNELVSKCPDHSLNKHELSYRYPEYNDYMVVLKLDIEGESRPFYVKVALHLPALQSGELVSFHEWGKRR